MRKNNIRKTKTDKRASYIIAQTLIMQISYLFVTFKGLDLMNLKGLGFSVKKQSSSESG